MSPYAYLGLLVLATAVLFGLSLLRTWLSDRWAARREDRLVARVAARVRADLERDPAHEVTCPACGATIRARMADTPCTDREGTPDAR